MTTRIVTPFEITAWEESPADTPTEGPPIARITVRKTFTGDLAGESTAELITCRSADDTTALYTAVERVTGTLDGRTGTFVIQHGGIAGGPEIRQFGWVVPGSATGDLRGLSATVHFQHDEHGALFTMDYDLP